MLHDNNNRNCYRSASYFYYPPPLVNAITPPYCQPYDDDDEEYKFWALTNNKDIIKDDLPLLSPPHTPPAAKHQSNCLNQLDKLLNRTQNRNSVIMKVENHQIKRISDELIHSDLDEFICKWENCYCKFLKLEDLGYHMQKHAVVGLGGLYYCRWEGCVRQERGFNARYKMLVHVRTHTKEKPHQCLECDKCFSRAENLKIHMRSHSGEKPYVCPVEGCNKAYSNSSDRFKHTRTHSNDKPYMCKVPGCLKRYTDPSSLRKHVKTYKHNELQMPNQSSTLVQVGFTSDESNKSCDYDCHVDDNNLIIDVVSVDNRDKEDFIYHQHQYHNHLHQLQSLSYERVSYNENCFGSLHPSSSVLHSLKHNPARNFLQNSTNFMKMYDGNSFPRETIKFENMEIDVPLDLRMHHR